jgi:hypothetical protein
MKFVWSLVALALVATACQSGPAIVPGGGNSPGGGPGGSNSGGVTDSGKPIPDFTFNPGHVDGGASVDTKNCGAKAFALTRSPAEILLVLDRSGSMGDPAMPGGLVSKWTSVTMAINETLMATNDTVHWGLKLFSDPAGCLVPDGVNVAIAPMNYMPVWTTIMATIPTGSTPTAQGVAKGAAYLKSIPTATPKYIVLATDGLPNCAGIGGGGANDEAGAIKAVADAAAATFHTFVIGIATAGTPADATLSMMAVAGGEPRATDPKYYPVTNRADLVATLGLIAGQVTNCLFPLDKVPPTRDGVSVRINGVVVPKDPTHMAGWDLTAGDKAVQVYGPICDKLKTSTGDNIEIIYECYIP